MSELKSIPVNEILQMMDVHVESVIDETGMDRRYVQNSYVEMFEVHFRKIREKLEDKKVEKKLKVGDAIWYLDMRTNEPMKDVVKNIDGDMVNYCECSDCLARVGTDREHYKFDYAIHKNSVFTNKEEMEEYLIKDVKSKLNRF